MKSIKSYVSLNEDECEDVIRLDNNESNLDIDREKILTIKGALNKVPFNKYPDNKNVKIRSLYSEYVEGITEKSVLAGNGSDEMIGLVIGALIEKGKKVLMFSKEFPMYEYYTSIYGGEVIKYETEKDGVVDVDKFIELGKKENVDLIVFSNPNNPTGIAVSKKEILKILKEFKDKTVIIDEAYYEFNGESVIPYIEEHNNLIVTRTLSKAWGLAALRIGFLISNKDRIKEIMDYKIPYTISGFSNKAAEIALKYPDIPVKNAKIIVEQREILFEELKAIEREAALNIEFFKSKSNYIYGKTTRKEILLKGLENKGIYIRNFEGNGFRITVGSPMQNKKLIEALKKIFVY